jgi:hypothetical protein
MFELNRPQPKLPAEAMTTFRIVQPRDQRVISACEVIGCEKWAQGWDVVLNPSISVEARAIEVIRSGSTRRTFRELPALPGAAVVVFRFESGQRCFDEHRTRPQVFIKRGGDWRGNPRQEMRRHASGADWQEDFALHQQRLAEAAQRG